MAGDIYRKTLYNNLVRVLLVVDVRGVPADRRETYGRIPCRTRSQEISRRIAKARL